MSLFTFIKKLFGIEEEKHVEEVIPAGPPDATLLQKNTLMSPNEKKLGGTKTVISVYAGNPFRKDEILPEIISSPQQPQEGDPIPPTQ